MAETNTEKLPRLFNCHTHIFTGDHVPPLLGKKILPLFLYYLLPLNIFVAFFRWWFTSRYSPYKIQFRYGYKVVVRWLYQARMLLIRYWLLRIVKLLVGLLIIVSAFHALYKPVLVPAMERSEISLPVLERLYQLLTDHGIFIIVDRWWLKALLLIILLLFFPSGRNLLWFILTKTVGFLKMLPGKETVALAKRYINIVRFARYEKQSGIFAKLCHQYPAEAGLVVLPMDMEFMEAGRPRKNYGQQMAELARIKENHPDKIFPFLFADPRRTEVNGQPFFAYKAVNGQIELEPCFIKDYMETRSFSGFKIYPALGYFPFDPALLPLWKYAQQKNIPIMTHCIRGVIYYRGSKKKEWDYHPVFNQWMGAKKEGEQRKPVYEKLLLHQMKASDVQEIFTHPMNYACLLKKELLAKVVGTCDLQTQQLFGYSKTKDEQGKEIETIEEGLEDLKICFGHFGGEDEWEKFMEKDRFDIANQLITRPDTGIDFLKDGNENKPGKQELLWKSADWYSLICSLMLQHRNIYADVSYILHCGENIMPLLHQTMMHEKLRTRVLYGSDFYVVRNHKSDKQMLAEMRGALSEEDFNQVARYNPAKYLERLP